MRKFICQGFSLQSLQGTYNHGMKIGFLKFENFFINRNYFFFSYTIKYVLNVQSLEILHDYMYMQITIVYPSLPENHICVQQTLRQINLGHIMTPREEKCRVAVSD